MQEQGINGYSSLDFMNHLQQTERRTKSKRDLETFRSCHINRKIVANTIKSWQHQNLEKKCVTIFEKLK